MERVIAELFDQHGVHCTDEDAGIGEPSGDRLVVSSGVLHADLSLTIQVPDDPDQSINIRLCMSEVTGLKDDLISRPADRNSAFAFRNIDTNCVHELYSFEIVLAMADTRFTHCLFNLLGVTRTRGSTCVKRTLRMRGWLAD